MSGKPATLIIPVENQVRELDAKLLIACCAAERGFPVIIGSQFFIYLAIPKLPVGVVFAKSMRAVNGMTLEMTNRMGNEIIANDEEGLVRFNSDEYYNWRYSKRTFAAISRIFSWGEDDAKMYASYAGYTGAPVHRTGNARIDLLRPELRGIFQQKADKLKAQYSKFILINTNFSFVNNFVSRLNLVQRDSSGRSLCISRTGSGLSRKFAEGMAVHQQAIYDGFRELMPRLCRWFPGTMFILRPHPSENHQVWRQIIKEEDNMRVIHEGNVVPWLMACQGLLHNGCTTAVEAAVLGKPAITYQPVCAEMYDYHLPNSLSHSASTEEQVREVLSLVINDEVGPICASIREEIFARHLSAISGPLAADRMINVLVESGYLDGFSWERNKIDHIYGRLGMKIRGYLQRIKMLQPYHRTNMKHHAHQFPYISTETINARIAIFAEELQRFSGLHAEMISPYIFKLECKNRGQSPG